MNELHNSRDIAVFYFITDLLGKRVVNEGMGLIGRLSDLEARFDGTYPEINNLIVARSFGRPPLKVPFALVKSLAGKAILISFQTESELTEIQGEDTGVLIKEMILDKRIIDTEEYEVEVVYDVHLLHTGGKMYVVHVDVSHAGMLRRLNLKWLASLIYRESAREQLLPWKYVQSLPTDIDRFKGDVRLKIQKERIAEIHPTDLADILEELSGTERIAVFDTLDTKTAADTLEETEPRVQRQLVANVRRERIAEILNTMAPAQVADLLQILPWSEAEGLKPYLSPDTVLRVNELLSQHEINLQSLATMKYLALPETASVNDAIARFREKSHRYDVVMYLYVITESGTLVGVVDIRELIQAEPNQTLGEIMIRQLVTLSPEDSLASAVEEFEQYGFVALPIVKMDRTIIGVVRHKDLFVVHGQTP